MTSRSRRLPPGPHCTPSRWSHRESPESLTSFRAPVVNPDPSGRARSSCRWPQPSSTRFATSGESWGSATAFARSLVAIRSRRPRHRWTLLLMIIDAFLDQVTKSALAPHREYLSSLLRPAVDIVRVDRAAGARQERATLGLTWEPKRSAIRAPVVGDDTRPPRATAQCAAIDVMDLQCRSRDCDFGVCQP